MLMGYQNVSDDGLWKAMAVEKNWKISLVATVNFGVTVVIEEIEFLNNQKVSEEKKSWSESKLTMLDSNITIVLANLKVIFSTENPIII